MQARLDAAEEEVSAAKAQVDAAEEEVKQLTAELDEKLATIDSLNGEIEALGAQAETDATRLEALQAQLAEAQAEADAKIEALEDAQTEYAERVEELEAYQLTRDIVSGEAHISTAVDNAIEVAQDGVTASWQYANSNLSGNAAVLRLELNGETIYSSGSLKPGEEIDSLTLNQPLDPGTYQAMAVTTVFDDKGEPQVTTRVPVTLRVAG